MKFEVATTSTKGKKKWNRTFTVEIEAHDHFPIRKWDAEAVLKIIAQGLEEERIEKRATKGKS